MHDEFGQYRLMHESYGHPCDTELKNMLQDKGVKGDPSNIKFLSKTLPWTA